MYVSPEFCPVHAWVGVKCFWNLEVGGMESVKRLLDFVQVCDSVEKEDDRLPLCLQLNYFQVEVIRRIECIIRTVNGDKLAGVEITYTLHIWVLMQQFYN